MKWLALHVLVCRLHFLPQLQSNGTRDIISSWGLVNNSFPFIVSLPLPFLRCLPLPFLRCLPHPIFLPILCTPPFPGSFLTTLRVLLTLAVVIVVDIARAATSTVRPSGILPVLIIIILIDYLIPIQWSNHEEVACLVLPAAWWLNLYPEIIATVPRETLAGAFNLP
jgi:hypothetical protein